MPYSSVRKVAEADFPSRWGRFRIHGFEGVSEPGSASLKRVDNVVALTMGDLSTNPPLVRIHSQCLTGDVLHSLRCDCHDQLHLALGMIAKEGAGILLYEEQEGRGIGLMAKLRAYELQDKGRDTIEANLELGFRADYREFELPAEILKALNIPAVRLITNNPEKVQALEDAGIRVVERVSATIPSEPTFERYLETKRDKMGHLVS
jgi:GTP cyclohydrolase II